MMFEQVIIEYIEKLQAHLNSIPEEKPKARIRFEQKLRFTAECTEAIRNLLSPMEEYPIALEQMQVKKLETETPYSRYTESYYGYHGQLIILLQLLNKKKVIISAIPEKYDKPKRDIVTKSSVRHIHEHSQFYELLGKLYSKFPEKACNIIDLQCVFLFVLMRESFCFFPDLPALLSGLTDDEIGAGTGELYLSATKDADKRNIRIPLSDRGQTILNALMLQNNHNKPFHGLNTALFNSWLKSMGFDMPFLAVRNLLINRTSLFLPPFIIAVMSNNLSFTSINPECRKRIYTGTVKPQRSASPRKNRKKIVNAPVQQQHFLVSEHITFIKTLSSEMHKAYRNNRRKTAQLQSNIEKLYNKNHGLISTNETLCLLTDWLFDLIRKPKKGSSLGTIVTYFGPFARVLIYETRSRPLSHMKSSEIIELIEKIINQDILKNGNKKNMGRRLKSFFRYYIIRFTHKDPNGEISDYLGSSEMRGTSSETRTGIITPHEFDMFINYINDTYPEDAQTMTLCSALAFWGGMRRSEIELFRVDRIQPGSHMIYRVPESKTSSGRRPMQLWAIMPEHYRNILIDELQKAEKRKYLLWEDDEERYYLNAEIFPNIIRELKNFFQDDELVFHSLRHSFASNMLIRMFKGKLPELAGILPPKYESGKITIADEENFRQLFKQESYTYGTDSLWRISEQLGHISPEISIQSYIHIIDWITEAFIKKQDKNETIISYQQFLRLFPDTDHGVFRQKILQTGLVEKGKIRLSNVRKWSEKRIRER
ncbi:MAG TPA: hypothetical protein DCM31_01300 [Deferribacteraceae bacterium]|nr:hypothetical protein [Deferribacteraceae bacterium]